MIAKDDENIVMIPLMWLGLDDRKSFIRVGYEVIPIPGYQETNGYRAFKIIGPYNDDIRWIHYYSFPIWEDWKLTAQYIYWTAKKDTTSGQQMFDRLDDDEKIQSLKYNWFTNVLEYIEKYFREHPDLLDRARHSLKLEEIHRHFKELYDN